MNSAVCTAFKTLALLFIIDGTAAGRPVAQTVSSSRQFIVYGPDVRLRGAVADLAERTKKTALVLMGERDAWKTPIVINAQYPEANFPEAPAAELRMSQTGFGLKLQLDLRLAPNVEAPAVEREVLRATYLEMMYRAAPETPPGTAYVQPPDWLLEGTLALREGRDSSALVAMLGTVSAAKKILPFDEFLRQRPDLLESPSRLLYRAYAAALLSLVTNFPEGRQRLARFVADLPHAGNDLAVELVRHFPVLGDDASKVQKNWELGVARFAASEHYRPLNCEETEREVSQVLRVELGDHEQNIYTLEEFTRFLTEPDAGPALQNLSQRLLLFSSRANPLFAPVISGYQEVITLLVRRKTKRVSERLATLRAAREHIGRRMSAISDYINWFEVTQARAASGAFRDYMKAAEERQENAPRRHDPISIYLDALEAQLGD